jgi:hypothetical protein
MNADKKPKTLTTARQSRNQKETSHHGDTETRRKPKTSQSQKPQHREHRETSEDAESRRFAEQNSSRIGTNLIVSNAKDATVAKEKDLRIAPSPAIRKNRPLINADDAESKGAAMKEKDQLLP